MNSNKMESVLKEYAVSVSLAQEILLILVNVRLMVFFKSY